MKRDSLCRRFLWLQLCLLTALLSACTARAPRFTNLPIVRVVNDTAEIPEPAENEFRRLSHHLENFTTKQLLLRLDPRVAGPSRDVNRLGEVVNSSWYENRTASLTPEQIGQGAGGDDRGPEAYKPWTILGLKMGGQNPGFICRDSRGTRYIFKFDKPGAPVIATAAGAVSARLLWACGYNVPDDRIVFFRREDLKLKPGTMVRREEGGKRPLLDADVDELLATLPSRTAGGDYRALVSRFLPGRPLGGYAYSGTRGDDPNDVIPHEDRRSLRGLRVFGAWLNHVDQKIDNTLDMYVEEDGRRFIRHYLVDFDGCLGGYWAARHEPRIGFAYDLDLIELFTGVAGVGLLKRPYEDLNLPAHDLIGLFESEVYDASGWKPNYLNDQLSFCRPADAFWAGNVLALISDAAIDHAVAAARFDDPEATDLLANIIKKRRDKTLDWALTQVTPVVDIADPAPAGAGLRIRARNALEKHGGPVSSRWRFRVEYLDSAGTPISATGGLQAEPTVTLSSRIIADRDYFVVRWTAVDQKRRELPPTEAHFLRSEGDWRLVGLVRDGQ